MKNKLIYLAAISLSLSVLLAAPSEINYQGVLTDHQGNPVNGVRAMQIKLYDAPTGGNMSYQENIGNVTVTDGIYSFKFGASGNGIASALNGNDHLALVVDSVEQSTRTKILAVPYALKAETVNMAFLSAERKAITIPINRFASEYNTMSWFFGQNNTAFPLTSAWSGSNRYSGGKGRWKFPDYVRKVKSITMTYSTYADSYGYMGSVNIGIIGSSWAGESFTNQLAEKTATLPIGAEIPLGEEWILNFETPPAFQNNSYYPGTGGRISSMSVEVEVSAAIAP